MSRDTIVKDDAGNSYNLDNYGTQKWLEGHPSGVRAAADYLRQKAVDLFKAGSDEAAVNMRKLAEDLTKAIVPKQAELAEEHLAEHPWKLGKL